MITFKRPQSRLQSMPKAIVRTRKIGGSLVVRIPKELVEQEGVGEGELVELEVQKARRDWFGAFPTVSPFREIRSWIRPHDWLRDRCLGMDRVPPRLSAGKANQGRLERGTPLATDSVTVAEVISKFTREGLDIEGPYKAITTSSRVVSLTDADARDAGVLHAGVKKNRANFSLGDAVVLNLARKTKTKVLTGDPDFRGLEEAEMLG